MAKRKVLYICHNHPALYPGGAETYALELYHGVRESIDFEPILLARCGPSSSGKSHAHPGTPFSMVNGDPNQYFIHANTADFDFFTLTGRNKDLFTTHYRNFLRAHRPDVVHFQHTHFVGLDLIRETHNTLPDAPMLYTLHEFLPICHRHGQMVRTTSELRCAEESPRRCHECFPEFSAQDFFLRKKLIQSHLELINLFIAPSEFLMNQFIEWGIPKSKIICEEYGRSTKSSPIDSKVGESSQRNRFAFFGQLSRFKGIDLLVRAMQLLADDEVDAHLSIHGDNLQFQPGEFQKELRALIEKSESHVTYAGPYAQSELSSRMADVDWVIVPSIWWENSPLVIQEAFRHSKPVICSDIGGMAEKVKHNVNGLHFQAGDVRHLARILRHAAEEGATLWPRLRNGIVEPYAMKDHVAYMADVYKRLLGRSTKGPA